MTRKVLVMGGHLKDCRPPDCARGTAIGKPLWKRMPVSKGTQLQAPQGTKELEPEIVKHEQKLEQKPSGVAEFSPGRGARTRTGTNEGTV